jgi:hypothetical protein
MTKTFTTVVLFTLMTLLAVSAVAQGVGKYYNKYWVHFADKQDNGYTLESPGDYLSPRALERREKFGIVIDSTDLPITQTYVDQVILAGGKVLHQSKWFNAVSVEVDDTNQVNAIRALPFVIQMEPVAATQIQSIEDCEDGPTSRKSTATRNTEYGQSTTQTTMVKGHYLHELGFRGEGMYIAIFDAGFEQVDQISAFDSLRSHNRILGTYDFVRVQENVYDLGSHGRNVFSIMAGNLPNEFLGSAPNASYFLFRTEEGATEYKIEEDNWVAAVERADSLGVDLVNTSLGYTSYDDPTMSYTYSDMTGRVARISLSATMAARKGMIIISSAGNEGSKSWHYISAPGDADSILTIGAVNGSGNFAKFSSYGPTADGRVKPDIVGMGQGTSFVGLAGTVEQGNGTSYSAPLLAGFVACLWQSDPTMQPQQIIRLVRETASTYNNPTDSFGYGIPDFQKAHYEILKNQNPVYGNMMPVVYPNPFVDKVDIVLNAEITGNYKLEMVDLMGSRVYTEDRNVSVASYQTYTLTDLGRLASGLYVVRITYPAGTIKVKIVKY